MSRATERLLWLPDILHDAGLDVIEVDGWETRGNDPIEWVAQVNHHTASNARAGAAPSLGIVTDGRPDVPGPLANTVPGRDGVVRIVAAGAANHPGVSYLPLRGGISSGVKYWTIGHEIELSGVGEPFPPGGLLWEVVHRMNAAIAAYLGHDPFTQLFDHKTIARPLGRKIDVRPYELAAGRLATAAKLAPPTTNPPEEDELMGAADNIITAMAMSHAVTQQKFQPYAVRISADDAPSLGLPQGSVHIVYPAAGSRRRPGRTDQATGKRINGREELDALYEAGEVRATGGGPRREAEVPARRIAYYLDISAP